MWQTEWRALSSRIKALLGAGHYFAAMHAVSSGDTFKARDVLIDQAQRVVSEVRNFHARHIDTLPSQACDAMGRFLELPLLAQLGPDAKASNDLVKTTLTMLASLEGEVTYLLSGVQEAVRRRSERALAHLQRSIIADLGTASAWSDAFQAGEMACEKLGAAHFLLHGIWAFKVDAAGGRTDLVLGEPLADLSAVSKAAESLVLTEWKLCRSADNPDKVFESAANQARRYSRARSTHIEP